MNKNLQNQRAILDVFEVPSYITHFGTKVTNALELRDKTMASCLILSLEFFRGLFWRTGGRKTPRMLTT